MPVPDRTLIGVPLLGAEGRLMGSSSSIHWAVRTVTGMNDNGVVGCVIPVAGILVGVIHYQQGRRQKCQNKQGSHENYLWMAAPKTAHPRMPMSRK